MTIFLSGRQLIGALCMQHSPTAATLSTNNSVCAKNVIVVFVLPGSAEVQVSWDGIVKRLLIVYFIGNICAKNYQNPFVCVSKL